MDKSSIEAVIAKIKELVAKGNVSRIVIKSKDGSELVNIPVNAGVVGGVVMLSAAKWVLIAGALATVVAGCTVEVVKENHEIISVVKPEDGEKIKNTAAAIVGEVKEKVIDFASDSAAKSEDIKNEDAKCSSAECAGAHDADVTEIHEEKAEEKEEK